jgi:hypothetical protein
MSKMIVGEEQQRMDSCRVVSRQAQYGGEIRPKRRNRVSESQKPTGATGKPTQASAHGESVIHCHLVAFDAENLGEIGSADCLSNTINRVGSRWGRIGACSDVKRPPKTFPNMSGIRPRGACFVL